MKILHACWNENAGAAFFTVALTAEETSRCEEQSARVEEALVLCTFVNWIFWLVF